MNRIFEFLDLRLKNRKKIPVLTLILTILLLLSFNACTVSSPNNSAHTSHSETTAEIGNGSTDSSDVSSEATESGANADAPNDTLLYYVSLVEELQEEIRILKAENFILSSLLASETEKDTSASARPSQPFTYELDDDEITILSYTGNEKHVTVPSSIDGYPVTEIGERAFSGTKIESIVLPETIEEIDWFAFSGCNALTQFTAGISLREIGYGAFDGCPSGLTLICPKGSYLEKYGKSFGIAVKTD